MIYFMYTIFPEHFVWIRDLKKGEEINKNMKIRVKSGIIRWKWVEREKKEKNEKFE